MIVYECDDSLESIFTAIYNAYEEKRNPEDTVLSLNRELFLFAEYVEVLIDQEKVIKVIRTLKNKFGEEDYLKICYALSSQDESKAQAVYQSVVYGLRNSSKIGQLFDNLADANLYKVFTLARGACREHLHFQGFVRFQECESGILLATIHPKNNVLTFLMPHFSDRFPNENFVLCDKKRNLYGVHPAYKTWYVIQGNLLLEEVDFGNLSEKELHYEELFRHFCHKISIKERENIKLQRSMLPLRFQEYMIEFQV